MLFRFHLINKLFGYQTRFKPLNTRLFRNSDRDSANLLLSASFDTIKKKKFVMLLYLSGLNMMEGILNKEQLAKVPSKT